MSDMLGIGSAVSGITQAIGELVGTMMTNDANNKVNRDNIGWQAKSLQATMNWQQHMRQTAYQDTMSDMKKAGLNPMLAFAQGPNNWGSVGSSPGSSVRAENPHLGNAAAAGASAFMNIASAREAINTQRTTQEVQRTEAALNTERANESRANTALRIAEEASQRGIPGVQRATISQLIASAQERLALLPVHEADSAQRRQDVVRNEAFGRRGNLTGVVEGLTALLQRLAGQSASSARNPVAQGIQRSLRPDGDRSHIIQQTPWF